MATARRDATGRAHGQEAGSSWLREWSALRMRVIGARRGVEDARGGYWKTPSRLGAT